MHHCNKNIYNNPSELFMFVGDERRKLYLINWRACISESLVGDQITIVLGCIYFPGVYVPWCNDNIILSHVQCLIIIKYEHCHVSLTHIWTIDNITKLKAFFCYILCATSTVYFSPSCCGSIQLLPGEF